MTGRPVFQTLLDGFWTAHDRFTPQPRGFRVPAHAQLWYELRCHGFVLKASTTLILGSIFVMVLVRAAGQDAGLSDCAGQHAGNASDHGWFAGRFARPHAASLVEAGLGHDVSSLSGPC